jgi:DNA polymerase-3 subunit delta
MKLSGAEANRFLAKPDASIAAVLIFGADAMRVALKRQEAIAAILGPMGEMRLTRLPGSDLRKSAAPLLDACREIGFFAGPRVVFVEDATDGTADSIGIALGEWRAGDAQIVITAGDLKGKSALKTLFEKHPGAVCIGLYNNPPTRAEIEADLAKAGLMGFDDPRFPDYMQEIGIPLDPADLRIVSEAAVAIWEMVKRGMGVAVMLREVAERTPGVVNLLPDTTPIPVPIWLVTHQELQSSPRIRLVEAIVAEELARM